MLAYVETYGVDDPWPTGAPDYGWACDYCGFRPDCAWWKDEPVQLAAVPGFGNRPSGIPAEQVLFGITDTEPEHVKLERLVMAYARERGIADVAQASIDRNRAKCDDAAHSAWLKGQIELAEAKA
jgi:hypothetical protein